MEVVAKPCPVGKNNLFLCSDILLSVIDFPKLFKIIIKCLLGSFNLVIKKLKKIYYNNQIIKINCI